MLFSGSQIFIHTKNSSSCHSNSIVYNGINYDKWNLIEVKTAQLKKKYSVEGKCAFTGRFEEQKNLFWQ